MTKSAKSCVGWAERSETTYHRNDQALQAIRQYSQQNPLRWHLDRYNPQAAERDPQAKVLWDLLKGVTAQTG